MKLTLKALRRLLTAQEINEVRRLMLTVTHAALAIASTSLFMGTADPWVLGTAAVASQFPDVDTTGSVLGRIFYPVSRWLEARFPHRSVTHSFLVTGLLAIVLLPLWFWGKPEFYCALLIGYWMGWFGDVFSKPGVAAFFPNQARLVIPANPRLRLSTGSKSESIVLACIIHEECRKATGKSLMAQKQ